MWARLKAYVWRGDAPPSLVWLHEIGHGASARVWLCEFEGTRVAAKVVRTSRMTRATQELLTNEIEIWKTLAHPNLVRLRQVFLEPQRCVLVSELMRETLRERHERMRRLGAKPRMITVMGALRDVARGLVYLHERNVMHRDLKSENVLIDLAEETYKIGDFGLCRRYFPGLEATAETGSYRWMAPEVIRHEPYNLSADVYSFTMIAYEAIALTTPFASTHSPVYAALAVARHGERPPLPPLPSDVSSLIERGWSQDAAARPTAREMQASVEAIIAKKESFGSLEMSARLAGDATTASA